MKNEIAIREIDSLDYYLQNHTDDYSEESHTAMMMAIDALRSSGKPNKWIPVGKKNPVAFEKVLVTFRLHYDDSIHIGIGNTTSNVNGRYYWNLDEQDFKTWDILAWMPLPEPYEPYQKGGKEPI